MVSTTHGQGGGGRPRLVFLESTSTYGQPGMADEYLLPAERPFSVGSSQDCDVTLLGLAPVHAEIARDESDEFVVLDHSGGRTTLDGAPAHGLSMHTGDRLDIGGFQFAFQRDEAYDHGRPYGGREGGEGSDQELQPPREPDPDAPLPKVDMPWPDEHVDESGARLTHGPVDPQRHAEPGR